MSQCVSLSLDLAYHNQESCQDDACQPLFPCLWRVGEETPWAGLLKAQRALVQYREATQAAGPLLWLGVSGSTGCLSGVLGVGGRRRGTTGRSCSPGGHTAPHDPRVWQYPFACSTGPLLCGPNSIDRAPPGPLMHPHQCYIDPTAHRSGGAGRRWAMHLPRGEQGDQQPYFCHIWILVSPPLPESLVPGGRCPAWFLCLLPL